MSYHQSQIKAALFGVAVGDALGVPVEFKSRETLDRNPVTEMTGYGTFNQPPGTWSDDSSLTFCLAEALTHDFDLGLIAQNFVDWYTKNLWTARGSVFDVGNATLHAIERLTRGVQPDLAGRTDENSNGNGSLMRILPLVFYIIDKPVDERFEITRKVCAITHGHVRSVIACFYYLEFARQILQGNDKFDVYKKLKEEVPFFLFQICIPPKEIDLYSRLLKEDIFLQPRENINSSGFVLDTLEASIWSLLTTSSFEEAVLTAVNLGQDTDTTSAVTGGMGALIYGYEKIPQTWLNKTARFKDIEDLAQRLSDKLSG